MSRLVSLVIAWARRIVEVSAQFYDLIVNNLGFPSRQNDRDIRRRDVTPNSKDLLVARVRGVGGNNRTLSGENQVRSICARPTLPHPCRDLPGKPDHQQGAAVGYFVHGYFLALTRTAHSHPSRGRTRTTGRTSSPKSLLELARIRKLELENRICGASQCRQKGL